MKSFAVRGILILSLAVALVVANGWTSLEASGPTLRVAETTVARPILDPANEQRIAGAKQGTTRAQDLREYQEAVARRTTEIYARLKELDILIAEPRSTSAVDDPAKGNYIQSHPYLRGLVAEYEAYRAELSTLAGSLKAATDEMKGLGAQSASNCPPATAINGALGKGSPDFPATSGLQTGRLLNGLGNVTCGSSNPCSLNTTTGLRAFDAFTFSNPSATTACVTVSFTMPGCSSGALMQFSARMGTFDPANPCANYVGDGGAGFSGDDHSFSFNVPAGQDFVVVVNENDPDEAPGCAYSLTISGVTCEALCPPATITGTIGQGSTDYPSTSGEQTARISQNGVDSSCASPKTCPGTASPGSSFTFDSYDFVNDSGAAACVTFTFPTSCGVNNAIHPVAYLDSFDPVNPCTNYLGDIGHSINSGESGAFSVNVPANSTIVLVVHETGTVPGCSDYSFSVTGLPCQQPCAISCPSNITKPNDPNQCGAVVTYPAPTAGLACGTVTCSPSSGSFFPVGTTTVNCATLPGPSCSFTVTVTNAILCPANITTPNDPNQCGAVVNYPAPTTSGGCGTVSCSPSAGSFFPVGTTTVACSISAGPSCSFTVTVADGQLPSITCPASLTVVAAQTCNQSTSAVVNFPPPTASDNCPGVTSSCSPASGSTFPVGTTTVICTATDAKGNTATCSFKVTVFGGCVQDDSNSGNVVLFNTSTGEYRFCCNGSVLASGIGTVTKKGCEFTIQHNTVDRRVLIKQSFATGKGSASIQSGPGNSACTVMDRNILDNSCQCGGA